MCMRYQGRGQKAENCRPLLTTYVYTYMAVVESNLCYASILYLVNHPKKF